MEDKHGQYKLFNQSRYGVQSFSQMKKEDLLKLKEKLNYLVDQLDPFSPQLTKELRATMKEFGLSKKDLQDPFYFTNKTLLWLELVNNELKTRDVFHPEDF